MKNSNIKNSVLVLFALLFFGCKNNSSITQEVEQQLSEDLFVNYSNPNKEYNVETFIDSNMQDITKQILEESLQKTQSTFGSVMIMETNTGRIKSIVNIEKDSNDIYKASKRNFINTPTEPVGLFKTFSVISLLEDQKADTSTMYNANGGVVYFGYLQLQDLHYKFHNISLGSAYQYSLTTVIAKLVDTAYKNNPKKYLNNIEKFGLNASFYQMKQDFEIPNPDSSWGILADLPWTSVGYNKHLRLTPLQFLTFYNTVANDGKMVEPLFLSKIKAKNGDEKVYDKPIFYNHSSYDGFSIETTRKMQDLMRRQVIDGHSKHVYSDNVSISGYSSQKQLPKTNWNIKDYDFSSRFIGYFPSKKPKYTIFVSIENPKDRKKDHVISGVTFKKLAELINKKF
jgi:cell division protein FtsI (penicillin-binding protein 3)